MDIPFTPLKTFALTRPVLYGAPLAAVIGIAFGLVFRIGGQIEDPAPEQSVNRAALEETAAPIAWPTGKVPDYVIGTDFLAPPQVQRTAATYYRDEEPFVMPPPMDVPPPLVTVARTPVTQPRWASTQGDILDVALPEDPPTGAPTSD